jgi:hypothetical protein
MSATHARHAVSNRAVEQQRGTQERFHRRAKRTTRSDEILRFRAQLELSSAMVPSKAWINGHPAGESPAKPSAARALQALPEICRRRLGRAARESLTINSMTVAWS